MPSTFRALLAEGARRAYNTALKDLPEDALPGGDVLVEVACSSLNYKDGLAVTGRGDIIRRFPMVCGIDLAGTVIDSRVPDFKPGDGVLAVGQGLGETEWGGYSQRARVAASALVPVPPGLSLQQAMAIGTAGFTAMLSLMALEHHGIRPGEREMLVTGAGGGVGSVAVALLAARGYTVAASTGRPELHDYLRGLGAVTIVDRATLAQKPPPLASERWAGGVDSVGGPTLASVLAATAAHGAVAACGLAGGVEVPTTVMPFILRNVALLGVNSVQAPKPLRLEAWSRLARELPRDKLERMTSVEPLSKIKELSDRILAGQIRGRVVVDVNA
ncbi:MAG: oxidoreductase [Gemmatimonadetes bacterium]|nr:oxidoreductase [Gemmatimonadota bacterium]